MTKDAVELWVGTVLPRGTVDMTWLVLQCPHPVPATKNDHMPPFSSLTCLGGSGAYQPGVASIGR